MNSPETFFPLRMLPYVVQPEWHLGPFTVHFFGLMVSVGLWVGLAMAEGRWRRADLDPAIGQRLGWWIIVSGVLGAHIFATLLYAPEQLRADPWIVLRIWDPISSFGGMIGGLIGAALFFAFRARDLSARSRLAYLDAVAFVFPVGLAFGRLGCALAHDHPGRVTEFPLAISLTSPAAREYIGEVYALAGKVLPADIGVLGFHDLGLYECLFLILVVVPTFRYLDRRVREPGFYLLAFAVLYLPVRFALDSLRVVDARYVGLTPAQWVAALTLSAIPLIAMDRRKAKFALSGAIILATAWACWGGTR